MLLLSYREYHDLTCDMFKYHNKYNDRYFSRSSVNIYKTTFNERSQRRQWMGLVRHIKKELLKRRYDKEQTKRDCFL